MAEPQRQRDDDALRIEAGRDERLVERVLRGDAEAYGELVARHMRRAFSIAWRILEHREDAEDVVQDAFVRALEHIGSRDRARPFSPWFYRIVVNQALNFRRARSVRATEPMHEQLVATTSSPEHDADNAMLRGRLRSALAILPERQRTIVQLADLEGFNSSEIADILEVPAGTVRWHLHQARTTLRTALGPHGEGP
jgi:RNA polymerase sigma-70 factor (ECF subfamily)